NNNIQLTKEHIENNPYIVDLSKTLSEYKIIALADETNALKTDDEKNIDDKNSPEKVVTDESSNQNINAEETLTDENFISTKSISIPIFAWIIAGMTIIAIIIFIILKRKN
ncbi:MAG: hypothetical protein SOZ71_06395, partial [Clostridium sp.]|nr:hypothetical protein [Clostridium sp.]